MCIVYYTTVPYAIKPLFETNDNIHKHNTRAKFKFWHPLANKNICPKTLASWGYVCGTTYQI